MTQWLEQVYLGNPLSRWLLAAGIFLATLAALWIFERLLNRRISKLASATKTAADDVLVAILASTWPFFRLFLGLWAGSRVLVLPAALGPAITIVTFLVLLLQIGIWANTGWSQWIEAARCKRAAKGESVTWMVGVESTGQVLIWTFVVLAGLENLGVNVSAVITGLGIGGVAVALAVQSVLGDLLAAVSIFIDKPFEIGDDLGVGDQRGTVESIGFRTTRLRASGGEQIIFSNSDLVGSRIHNFGRLKERRAAFTVGVTYDTPRDKVEAIPDVIRKIVEAQQPVRFGRSHFKEFGDSALVVQTVYSVLSHDYQTYMDIQQAVNLELMRQFAAEGIEMAFPTQTIVLETGGVEAGDGATAAADSSQQAS